ncbi:FAD-binding domain protein [Gregarina niphandrodes]|uniref:FAD-binding domain protein n=1 Tax=Gregarina niphandrodes TaxID=110365 RepID=A0A023BDG3_GRENI|nr:FAD-binding domain protein [Gregarina niphandrodes]EZG87445.1 FAD-binding domain protein [Gregarina niphandrodes]|eukprot:XP_011128650.1 FAD-binding domain protein [Gregarina niphandrodes]
MFTSGNDRRRWRFPWFWMITALVLATAYAAKRAGLFSKSEEMRDTVVVIGGGAAGLAAALQLLEQHAADAATPRGTSPVVPESGGESSVRVVLIEKARLGGNSQKATSGVNAAATRFQEDLSIPDSSDQFVDDILRSGKGSSVPTLAHVLSSRSGAAINHLASRLDLGITDVNALGGHSVRRTHRFPPSRTDPKPFGLNVMLPLAGTLRQKAAAQNPQLVIMEKTEVVDIGFKSLTVPAGSTHQMSSRQYKLADYVQVKDLEGHLSTIPVKSVVVASGGYAGDSGSDSFLSVLRPDLVSYPTTNNPTSSGDLHRILIKNGLTPYELDKVQLHPTGFVDLKDVRKSTKFLCPEVFRSLGAILLNSKGLRFVDELETRDKVTAAIIEHGGLESEWGLRKTTDQSTDHLDRLPTSDQLDQLEKEQSLALLVFDDDIAERFGIAAFEFYKRRGFIHTINTAADFGAVVQTFEHEVLTEQFCKSSLEKKVAKEGTKEATEGTKEATEGTKEATEGTEKAAEGTKEATEGTKQATEGIKAAAIEGAGTKEALHVAFITPSLHYSLGGMLIDDTCRAQQGNKVVVPNMFVAGEASGGLHGANRLGGNGITEGLVLGTLAGEMAGQADCRFHLWPTTGSVMVQSQLLSKENDRLRILLPDLAAVPKPNLGLDHLFVEAWHHDREPIEFTSIQVVSAEPGVLVLQATGDFTRVDAGDRVVFHVTVHD